MADGEKVKIRPEDVGTAESVLTAPAPKHNSELYPEIWPIFEQLRAKKAELEKVVNPLREKRDKLAASIAPVEAEMRQLAEQIRKHMPEMAALDRQIGVLARAMKAKTVGSETPEAPAA